LTPTRNQRQLSKVAALIGSVLGCSLSIAASAQDTTPPSILDPCASLKDLANAYTAAIAAHDPARIEALQEPLLDSCRDEASQDVYRWVIEAEAAAHLDPDPRLIMQELDASFETQSNVLEDVSGESLELPIQPTHYFEFTVRAPHPAGHPCASVPGRVRKLAARRDGCWQVVPQCLTKTMLERLREEQHSKVLIDRMRDELDRELEAPVRQELLDQVQRGNAQAAFEQASELYGSKGKAYRLIERLCEKL